MTQDRIERLTDQAAGMLQALTEADPDAARMLPAVWRVLGDGRPATVEQIAATAGQPPDTVAGLVHGNPQVEVDNRGRLLGFGLTLLPTPYRVDLAGHGYALYGWCAPDILAIPWLLGRPGRVTSRCRATGTSITAHVGPEGVGEAEPADVVVSFVPTLDTADIRGSTCGRQHFFASPDAAAGWLAEHPHGAVVPVAEAFQVVTGAFQRAGWVHARAEARDA